ncbi:MAG: peptidoglycan-binding protein [Acidobacteria bacterium]|nr:peptidoglycan-binding protein [Acidobacteriota bacterium]
MKRTLVAVLTAVLCLAGVASAQNTNSSKTGGNSNAAVKAPKKRGPIFRATKEQIKQAQGILKQRGFYAGEASGKLDTDTRGGLRKYQEAEGLKVTGTLNRVTLEKMNVALTDKQKAIPAAGN